jgi:hypothetical protein
MSDRETEYFIELQGNLMGKFAELGIITQPWTTEFLHHLADVAAKGRTLEREILPLLLTVNTSRREVIREIFLGIRTHLDSIQDSIRDLQPSLRDLLDYYE